MPPFVSIHAIAFCSHRGTDAFFPYTASQTWRTLLVLEGSSYNVKCFNVGLFEKCSCVWLLCGAFFFHPSPPLFHLFDTLTLDRRGKKDRGKRKGAVLSLDYFLLISGIEILGASLIFSIRISNFLFVFYS